MDPGRVAARRAAAAAVAVPASGAGGGAPTRHAPWTPALLLLGMLAAIVAFDYCLGMLIRGVSSVWLRYT